MGNTSQEKKSSQDWQCWFDANSRFQLQYFKSLRIEDKFKAVEDMCEVVEFFNEKAAKRRKSG